MAQIGTLPPIYTRQAIEHALLEEKDPEQLYAMGLSCYRQKMLPEAKRLFLKAKEAKPDEPRYCSYCGLLLAVADRKLKEAEKLCEAAVVRDHLHADLFYNLGRVYLMQGCRQKAHQTFRKGLNIDSGNGDLQREMENMGIRKTPFFPFLNRDNALNRLAGKIRSRLFKDTSMAEAQPAKAGR